MHKHTQTWPLQRRNNVLSYRKLWNEQTYSKVLLEFRCKGKHSKMFLKTTICLSRSLILSYKTTLVVGVVLLNPRYLTYPPVCCYQHRTVWDQALPLLILQAHKSALSVRQYCPRLSTFCPLLSALWLMYWSAMQTYTLPTVTEQKGLKGLSQGTDSMKLAVHWRWWAIMFPFDVVDLLRLYICCNKQLFSGLRRWLEKTVNNNGFKCIQKLSFPNVIWQTKCFNMTVKALNCLKENINILLQYSHLWFRKPCGEERLLNSVLSYLRGFWKCYCISSTVLHYY